MNYYDEIKNELINNDVYKKIKDYSKNRSDLNTYYNVGKLLIEAGKQHGKGIIKEYSKKLTAELKINYDVSYLNKMKKFYKFIEKVATVSPELSYSHYIELLPLKDINEINYYIKQIKEENLSIRELRKKIKNKEYERLDDKTKNKLIKNEYKIKLGDKYNYIDLLLYNIKFKCYIVC